MNLYLRALISTLILLVNTSIWAHNGPGGNWHGAYGPNNGVYHNYNGYNNNGYNYNNAYNRNNVWYGDGSNVIVNGRDDDIWYDDGVNDDDSANVVMGVPDNGYYDPSCQTVQTCNSDGECVTQQTCN